MTFATDPWTDRLSEYVDGDLDPPTHRALEAHLLVCARCRATRDELQRVVARAHASGYREPAHDLWLRVEAAVRTSRHRSRRPFVVSLTLGRLAAAAGLVAVIAGGLAWTIATRRAMSLPPVAVEPGPAVRAAMPASAGIGAAALAVASYRDAARDLERALDAGRGTLRQETMLVIEANLRAIDVAIAQADSALRQDPGSEYLNQYLVATMQRKLKLLRHAVAITSPRT